MDAVCSFVRLLGILERNFLVNPVQRCSCFRAALFMYELANKLTLQGDASGCWPCTISETGKENVFGVYTISFSGGIINSEPALYHLFKS